VVERGRRLKGLITVKDISKRIKYPEATKDEQGRLRVGAAGRRRADALERAAALVDAEVDVLVVDTAHGHSHRRPRRRAADRSAHDVQLVAGNISSADGALALADAERRCEGWPGPRLDLHGRGSSPGVGVPQITAVYDAPQALAGPGDSRDRRRRSAQLRRHREGDRRGADVVMLGSMLAARTRRRRGHRRAGRALQGVPRDGLARAMKARSFSKDRYFQGTSRTSTSSSRRDRGRVPYKGPLAPIVHQVVGGLRSRWLLRRRHDRRT
jgi:IMP dehydrogenase